MNTATHFHTAKILMMMMMMRMMMMMMTAKTDMTMMMTMKMTNNGKCHTKLLCTTFRTNTNISPLFVIFSSKAHT
jgi:hypothetical protein